ncbi:MAG: helix-turn-helix domain-containing protein [Oscillospiraceae bacterium]
MTLKALRKAAKKNQSDVAESLGVSQVSVCQWETGKAYPHPSKIPKLAKLYGVTADELIEAMNSGRKEKSAATEDSA